MTPAALAAIAVLVAADPLTDRIDQANRAAQSLQGPLAGAWTLRNGAGGALYVFQMSDPPGSVGPARGAWRDGAGGTGPADFTQLDGRRLRVRIGGVAREIAFTRTNRVWRGSLPGYGVVTLVHGLATPRSPV